MNKVKCVIFDCDGILVDSEAIANKILLSMAQEHGFEMTMEEAKINFNGRGLNDNLRYIEQHIRKKLPDDFVADFRKRTFQAFSTDLKPVAGVKEFIDSLTIPYCVASSGPVEKIKHNLTITGLMDKFENRIFSSYQINSWKPDPGIFLFAAREMGFQVNECIVIEDSIAGVIAAVKGGFTVYGFARETNPEVLRAEGASVFYHFEELYPLLAHR